MRKNNVKKEILEKVQNENKDMFDVVLIGGGRTPDTDSLIGKNIMRNTVLRNKKDSKIRQKQLNSYLSPSEKKINKLKYFIVKVVNDKYV